MADPKGGRVIPITCDKRTLEERKRDMVSSLEKNYADLPSGGKKQKTCDGNDQPNEGHLNSFDWFDEVNRWVENTRKLWADDMRRMRTGAFALVPADEFDLHPVNMFGPMGIFGPGGDIPAILNKMERQAHALERALLDADSHSGVIVPHEGRGGLLDFLKDVYELDERGQVRFKVRFQVDGFSPEDIRVTTSKNRLNVHAKKVLKTKNSESTNEFCRTIYLPSTVDQDHFQCHLTKDGILMVEAPLKDPDYKSITFDKERQLGIRPHSVPVVSQAGNQEAVVLKPTGHPGATTIGEAGNKKFHVEFPVEPGFSAKNMCVRMETNEIVVTGKQELTEISGENKSVHVKEFKRSYTVPETVDPLSIHAQLVGNTLVIEAPMIHSS
ncbi:unnamed protein product [Calicophoron daubneyi]|uniref:SHSP domain-containing protein n=1 Tax=Calicophoron daubneyi TaxID=300641 RepID=A0AAV2T5Q7_CALDB